jgi:tetratricopeptide (TPR) repeat protein
MSNAELNERIEAAEEAFASGDAAVAELILRDVLSIEPHNARALNDLAVVVQAMDRFDEALALLQTAVRVRPDEALALSNLVALSRDRGQPSLAADALAAWLRRNPEDTAAWNRAALCQLEAGRLDEARRSLAGSLFADPLQSEVAETLDGLRRQADTEEHQELALQALTRVDADMLGPLEAYIRPYRTSGDYCNYGGVLADTFGPGEEWLRFDEEGVPLARYVLPVPTASAEFHYNPVTISQYMLMLYGRTLRGEDCVEVLVRCAERLIRLQDEVGAFRYDFAWYYYLTRTIFPPGWISGMAQGQAVSALVRLHLLTRDQRYLEASSRAIRVLTAPVHTGGTAVTLAHLDPSLESYVSFEEYISEPPSYTLNGFLFAVLGLYDWWQMCRHRGHPAAKDAEAAFGHAIASIERLLPYYDVGGCTAYDLGHVMRGGRPHVVPRYHGIHVYLLHALHDVSGSAVLRSYRDAWYAYVRIARRLGTTRS